jgi:hypothetical protein
MPYWDRELWQGFLWALCTLQFFLFKIMRNRFFLESFSERFWHFRRMCLIVVKGTGVSSFASFLCFKLLTFKITSLLSSRLPERGPTSNLLFCIILCRTGAVCISVSEFNGNVVLREASGKMI